MIPTASRREALARVYHRAWFREAPLLICVTGLAGEAWARRDGKMAQLKPEQDYPAGFRFTADSKMLVQIGRAHV